MILPRAVTKVLVSRVIERTIDEANEEARIHNERDTNPATPTATTLKATVRMTTKARVRAASNHGVNPESDDDDGNHIDALDIGGHTNDMNTGEVSRFHEDRYRDQAASRIWNCLSSHQHREFRPLLG
ncbi:hypothetical protein DVH05_020378 [Phytophthora capsici]|nr:hypothetical protein DVH05_020378 [Phytophthora capsici]